MEFLSLMEKASGLKEARRTLYVFPLRGNDFPPTETAGKHYSFLKPILFFKALEPT
jgi:hypothetical protein